MITKTFVEDQAKQLAERIKKSFQTLSPEAIQKMIESSFLESVSQTEQACATLNKRTNDAEAAYKKAAADLEVSKVRTNLLEDTVKQVRELVVRAEIVKAA